MSRGGFGTNGGRNVWLDVQRALIRYGFFLNLFLEFSWANSFLSSFLPSFSSSDGQQLWFRTLMIN